MVNNILAHGGYDIQDLAACSESLENWSQGYSTDGLFMTHVNDT
jgi:hypothetical protein